MARDTPNVTILQTLSEEPDYDYAETAEALDVGDLVEVSGGQLQAHSTAAEQRTQPKFCIESRENGMVADDPDNETDNYDSGLLGKYITCDGGEGILANLAAGENVAEDDRLVSDGAGKLRAFDSAGGDDPNSVVAQAEEAVDNSGGSTFAKIRVEVLN